MTKVGGEEKVAAESGLWSSNHQGVLHKDAGDMSEANWKADWTPAAPPPPCPSQTGEVSRQQGLSLPSPGDYDAVLSNI